MFQPTVDVHTRPAPPPPPAKTKPRIVSMVPVKNCCEATEAWLIALCTRVWAYALYTGTSWYMYAVYAPVRYLRKPSFVAFNFGGKMAVRSFHFCRR